MRIPVFACLAASVGLAALCGCIDNDQVRVQSFAAGPNGTFTYAAQTNTVMTENDDGAAEQIRRDWLAQALEAQGMCNGGYVVYQRRLAIPAQRPAFLGPENSAAAAISPDADLAFGNGGDVVYSGSCL
jgi:hypothetical protein